jgi:hypothetical protein
MTDEFDEDDFNIDEVSDIDDANIEDVTQFSTQKLCDIIVCYRYLGLNKDLSIKCMAELGVRRAKGENFDFEFYIDNALKDMPVLDFQMPDLGTVLRQLGGKLAK